MLPVAPLRIGTAGWSHPDWNALVYPRPKPRGFHALEYLAGCLDTVEVNATFHQMPRPELTSLWASRVARNPRFQFTVRLLRRFTHDRDWSGKDLVLFREGLRPLVRTGRLACLLAQFPPGFRFHAANRDYLLRLRGQFPEAPLVAEFRHSSWLRDEALGVLIDHKIGFANIDPPPPIHPATPVLTSSIGYVRLHGRSANWVDPESPAATAREPYVYPEDVLREWLEPLQYLRRFARAVYVSFCNEVAAASFANALQLRRLAEPGVELPRIPAALAARYRRAMEDFRTDRGVQRTLFEDNSRAVA